MTFTSLPLYLKIGRTTVMNIHVSEAIWSYMTGSEQYFTSLANGTDLIPFHFLPSVQQC